MALWRLAWKQAVGTGSLAIIASLGLLLAIALLAVGPLYLGALQRLAFDRSLRDLGNNFHPQVVVPYSSFQPDEYQRARSAVEASAKGALGKKLDRRGVYASTRLIEAAPTDPPGFRAPAFFQYRSDIEDRTTIVSGRLPQAGAGTEIEVALGQPLAERMGLKVGQRFKLETGLPQPSPAFDAVLVGVIAPQDLADAFWLGQGAVYFESYTVNDQWVLALFVAEGTLLQQVGAAAPALLGEVNDFLYLNRDEILAAGPQAVGRALLGLEAGLAPTIPQARVFAALQGAVETQMRRTSISRTPLIILLVLVEAAALYALVLIAVAVSQRQEASVALLRSRGAGILQAVTVILLWGIGLAGLALLLAPGMAAGAVALLGYTPAWTAITEAGFLPPGPVPAALPWVAAGAVLSAIILLLPSTSAAYLPVVMLRRQRGRPAGRFRPQRLFLDAGLVTLVSVVLWQLRRRGGISAPGGEGTAQAAVDRAALLVPVLALVLGVLLFFRFLPLLLRLGAWLTRRTGPLGVGLALERMSRAPGPSMAVGGLLLVAVTLGTFAATFGGTLDRSAAEQAAYAVGTDARVQRLGGFEGWSFDELRRRFEAVPGVEDVGGGYRTLAGLGSLTVGTQAPLLAVDPGTASSLFWFREDFAEEPMADLLARLALTQGGRPRARTAPESTIAIGLWVRPEEPARNRFLWLHVVDGTGRGHIYTLGALDFTDWRYLEAILAQGPQPAPPGPYVVDSIQIYETATGASGAPGALLLDDLQARFPDGSHTVLDTFDRPQDWLPILTTGGRRDVVEAAPTENPAHSIAVRFRWGRETLEGVRGLYVSPTFSAVPILATQEFLDASGLAVEQTGSLHVSSRVVPVRVAGTVRQFPTLAPGPVGFAVADGPSLLAHLNAVNVGRPVWPNEAYLDLTADPTDREEALKAIQADPTMTGAVVDRLTMQSARQRSPLDSAGWRGLAALAVLAALAAVAIGLGAQIASAVRERAGDLALLRALGLPKAAALASFLAEHGSVAALGGASGVVLGLWLSNALIPLFQGTQGVAVYPTAVLTTDWRLVVTILAAIGAGALTTALLLWRAYVTVPVASILRMGPE